MMSRSRIYNARINRVSFSLAGSKDVEKDSFINVQTYDLVRNNVPYPSGVNDAHMGTLDYLYKCQTCYGNKHGCLGHPGHIVMNYPVWNPMFIGEGRKWLKLICFKCGKPIIDLAPFMKTVREKILDEASRVARVGNKRCIHCKEIHPIVKKNLGISPLALVAEIYDEKKQVEKWVIYPHKAGEILSRISDEDVVRLGKSISSHPRNIILHSIQVPPVTVRPDVKKIGGGRSTNDDLTTMLQIIIKKNETMPPVVPATIDPKLEKAIFDHNMAYYDFIKSGGEGMTSLAHRLRGKTGRFRKYQMGKRVRNICRSTIAGDPRLRIDEVGVPLVFARTIQYEEIVQEYNKKQLLLYVQNGRKRYPGATKIIKKNSGAEHDVDSTREIELENGDIVLRDMLDGDPVNFNRQPSLTISNISTHRAKIILDPSIKTLLMNVSATPLDYTITAL
jgi:DNA-directed RNA polymerase II subunit RPB1